MHQTRSAYDRLRQAMDACERASDRRLAGNDDAILRWNGCARVIMNHSDLTAAEDETGEQMLE